MISNFWHSFHYFKIILKFVYAYEAVQRISKIWKNETHLYLHYLPVQIFRFHRERKNNIIKRLLWCKFVRNLFAIAMRYNYRTLPTIIIYLWLIYSIINLLYSFTQGCIPNISKLGKPFHYGVLKLINCGKEKIKIKICNFVWCGWLALRVGI